MRNLSDFEGRLNASLLIVEDLKKTSPILKHENGDRIEFPLGLLVAKMAAVLLSVH